MLEMKKGGKINEWKIKKDYKSLWHG
jgi:hypothetical protein